jgi:Flp pilus assembly protein TadD
MPSILIITVALCIATTLSTALSQNRAQLYQKAITWVEQQQFDSAETAFQQLLRADSTSPELYVSRAQMYLQQKRNSEAYSDATRAIELSPSMHAPWYVRGVALTRLGRLELAASDYRQAISLDSSFSPQWLNLGIVLMESGNPVPASVAWKRYLQINPASPQRNSIEMFLHNISATPEGAYDSLFDCAGKAVKVILPSSFMGSHTTMQGTEASMIGLPSHPNDTMATHVRCIVQYTADVQKAGALTGDVDARFLLEMFAQELQADSAAATKFATVSKAPVRFGDWYGSIGEYLVQQQPNAPRLARYQVVVAQNNRFIVVQYEAPVEYWPAYKDRFFESIKALSLPTE